MTMSPRSWVHREGGLGYTFAVFSLSLRCLFASRSGGFTAQSLCCRVALPLVLVVCRVVCPSFPGVGRLVCPPVVLVGRWFVRPAPFALFGKVAQALPDNDAPGPAVFSWSRVLRPWWTFRRPFVRLTSWPIPGQRVGYPTGCGGGPIRRLRTTTGCGCATFAEVSPANELAGGRSGGHVRTRAETGSAAGTRSAPWWVGGHTMRQPKSDVPAPAVRPGVRVRTVAETHGVVVSVVRGWATVRLDHTGTTKAYRPDTLVVQDETTDPRRTTDRPICCDECGSDTPHDAVVVRGDQTLCPECAGTAAAPPAVQVSKAQAAKLAQRPINEARPLGTPTPPAPRPAKVALVPTNGRPTDPRATLRHAIGHLVTSDQAACADATDLLLGHLRTSVWDVAPTPAPATRTPKVPREPKAPKEPRPCLCGCGELTGSSFRMGHDARFHGWMKRIADGKLDPATLPASAVALMSLVDGKPTTDYDGSPWTR